MSEDVLDQAEALADALIKSYGVGVAHRKPLVHLLEIELTYARDAGIEATAEDDTVEDSDPEDVVAVVVRKVCIANGLGVTVAEVMGRGRHSRVARTRFECWRILSTKGFSSNEIGKLFDRDHTTVLNGLKRVLNGHG